MTDTVKPRHRIASQVGQAAWGQSTPPQITLGQKLLRSLDWPIIFLTLGLICFGLLMVFSASMYIPNGTQGPDPIGAVVKQGMSVILGGVLAAILFLIPGRILSHPTYILLGQGLVIFLLLVTYFIGETAFGAKSWIVVGGFSFQPSELAKIGSLFALAWLLNYASREYMLAKESQTLKRNRWLMIGSIGLSGLIIALQPDLGMLFIMFFSLGIFWAVYGTSFRNNIVVYFGILLLFIILYAFASRFAGELINSNRHFLERLGIYVNPFVDESNVGYQLVNGYVAFSRGGLWGVGLGNGVLKQGALPAIQNDFIIANIAEELGMVGVIGLLLVYWALFVRIFRQAALASGSFRSQIIGGMGILLFVQLMINIGGVLGMIPLTGVTLPLISSGGSSMIISILAIGFIVKMIYEENELRYQTKKVREWN